MTNFWKKTTTTHACVFVGAAERVEGERNVYMSCEEQFKILWEN